MKRWQAGALTTVAALGVSGCGGDKPAPPATSATASIVVTSPSFAEGGTIPADFTCTGAKKRPEIDWTGGGAAAYALVVSDPDAPGGTYYHWVVVDLPGGTTSIGATLPAGAEELGNSNGDPGWTPPCPPSGTHHYRFTVYGLPGPSGLTAGTSPADAFDTISKAATAQGTLTGLVAH